MPYPTPDPDPAVYDYWANPAWMVQAPNTTNDPYYWGVSSATTGDSTATLLRQKYGDGYAQVARDGFSQPEDSVKIDVSPIPRELASDIYAFLRAQATFGKPFFWTPPAPMEPVAVLWTCERYGWKRAGGEIVGITAEFQYLARA